MLARTGSVEGREDCRGMTTGGEEGEDCSVSDEEGDDDDSESEIQTKNC